MSPGSFEANIALLDEFSQRVAALSPTAWERLRERCVPLSGNTPDALYARANLFARPYVANLTEGLEANNVPMPPFWRALSYAGEGFFITLGALFEVAVAVAPKLDEPGPPRRASTGKPANDAYIDAFHRIQSSVKKHSRYDEGVHTTLHAAAQAILHRNTLTQAEFLSIYRWIEDEIPFASLTPMFSAK